ncbi:MAG: MinD/ParA family protein [Haloarcula sp.]
MILAVTGGKGGVGKSTIAYNLAAELDALERRDGEEQPPRSSAGSVVVDGDLGMADLPASRGPDLHDVLAGRADPLEAICEDGPVTIVPCGRTLAGARSADVHRLTDVFGALERSYQWVVVDSPAGLHADVGLPLAAADAALLVTTAESAALADALRVRALARELDAGLCRVVLNRAGPSPATEAVADRFGAPAIAIPESEPLATAQLHGQPLRETAPGTPARGSLESLAEAVHSCSSV